MKQIELQTDSDGTYYADLRVEIRIERDPDPLSYLDEFDRLGTIIYRHRRYRLGDKEIKGRLGLYIEVLGEETVERILGYPVEWADRDADQNLRLAKAFDKVAIALPVYLYDHSGLSISTRSFIGRAPHAFWDSGQVGWIYVTKERIREEYGVQRITWRVRDRAIEALEGEIEDFDTFLRGNIWGYTVTVEADGEEEYHDSCWGFYGDPRGELLYQVNAGLEQFGLQAVI